MAKHDTDSLDCWCRPEFFKACDECDGGCWKCDRGMVWLTREDAGAETASVVIVHVEPGDTRHTPVA